MCLQEVKALQFLFAFFSQTCDATRERGIYHEPVVQIIACACPNFRHTHVNVAAAFTINIHHAAAESVTPTLLTSWCFVGQNCVARMSLTRLLLCQNGGVVVSEAFLALHGFLFEAVSFN